MHPYTVDTAVVVGAAACLALYSSWGKKRAPYPPGPKGLPIVGNLLDMPTEHSWEAARQWSEKYGPMVYVNNLGSPFLFLNSYQVMIDLLEKKGSIYSSRPRAPMVDLGGWYDWFIALFPYGDDLRRSRQLLHKYFQQSAVQDYLPIQESSAHNLLKGLLKTPDNFAHLIRHAVGESILMVAYGYKTIEKDDPYIEIAEKGMDSLVTSLDFYLVNLIPMLRYLPKWFPGAQFLGIAKEGYKNGMNMYRKPHEMTKKKVLDGTALPSITSKLIEDNRSEKGEILNEELIAKVTGITYGGGADTTVSALLTFVLAMVLHPEVMKRGQEELDRVVGKNNLPTFDDRPNLPYIEAILKECLRWQVVGPFAMAHALTQDDEYNGYFIPAGTTILPNLWAALRDPEYYSEADKFIPERWLTENPPLDPNKIVYGIGRRICPGRYFADNSLYISITSMLAAFNIEKKIGSDGKPITPSDEYTSQFIRHPLPFECSITPRSDEIVSLIHQSVEASN